MQGWSPEVKAGRLDPKPNHSTQLRTTRKT